ncbi:MAG: MATE family efflux transporter [Gammaproteobacteria bacterium]|nr:MATE family efflux transporter [Gammaproteobacteria bacterium]
MTRDPYSNRAIWAIALPMIVSSVSVPLVGIVGTGVLGHLDDAVYLASVAAAAQLFSILFVAFNFLRMGTTGITAQAHGSGAHNPGASTAIRQALGEAIIVALALGIVVVILQAPISRAAFAIIGAEPEVTNYGRQYFDIRVWSAPATLFNYAALGWLLGMQNARGPLAITLVINLSNVALDLWFVLGLGLKVRGVATGALLAELAGAAVAVWLLRRELRRYPGSWTGTRLGDLQSYRRLLKINGNLFIRTLALMFTFGFMTAWGARMGSIFLAANALLLNFQWFTSYALDGLANAAEALVGKAVGARDRDGMLRAVRRTLVWSVGFGAIFSLAFWIAGAAIIRTLTSLPDIRETALEYLPWVVVLPLISVWSFFYDGVYVGATLSREMRVVMTSAAALVFLPVWFITQELGNHGLWLAFTAFMALRGLGMHLWFNRLKGTLANGQAH